MFLGSLVSVETHVLTTCFACVSFSLSRAGMGRLISSVKCKFFLIFWEPFPCVMVTPNSLKHWSHCLICHFSLLSYVNTADM